MRLSERDCASTPAPLPRNCERPRVVRFGCGTELGDKVLTVPAHRKLDAHAVEQVVAARGAGRSYRQIGASLGCSHSTLSRRVASEPELQARIAVAKQREARRARDRARKAEATMRRQAALRPASPPEQGQRPRVGASPGDEQALLAPAPQLASGVAPFAPDPASRPYPAPVRKGRRRRERVLRALPLGGGVDATPRSGLEERKAVPAFELHPDLVSVHRGGENQKVEAHEAAASRPRGGQEAARVSRTRPHGRRDELRAARRILLDARASPEAREAARETLLELLHATRSNSRPAYSLRLAAAKALMNDPYRTQAYKRPSASCSKGGADLEDLVDLGLLPRKTIRLWIAASERAEGERARAGAAEKHMQHQLGRARRELLAPAHQPDERGPPAEGRLPLPLSPQPRTVRVGRRDLLLFPDTSEGQEARFAYYEERRLVDPPFSIWDSNAVRSGRLTALERVHFQRMGR